MFLYDYFSYYSLLWTIITIYYVTSSFFLRYPTLLPFIKFELRRREKSGILGKGNGCLHISHRGGSEERPENTQMAFEHAILDCCTDMIETDVWLTKENELIVLHDNHLGNICGVDKYVGDLLYNELPLTLDSDTLCPSSEYLDISKWCGFPIKFQGQRILTLETLFQIFPNIRMSIDIKNPNSLVAVERTVEIIRKYKREDLTVIASFSHSNIKYLRKINDSLVRIHSEDNEENFRSRLILGASQTTVIYLLLAYFIGLLPFISINEDIYSFPLSYIFFCKYGYTVSRLSFLGSNITNYIKLHLIPNILMWIFSRRLMIRHLQKRGIRCFAWVCNTEEEIERCCKLGLDGIMTDKPTLLRDYYNRNNIQAFM
ncbi:glycerophosphoryl diester phosphodiesterase family protein [Cryptosporidium andersoni]|uniref:Glycerophosphoryl diester phosphodiesterase family protein n=1 Tax=Cryptosporidium andersoni TaxID=117008 RepID=A0A1J4MYC1_9CRYT|nr:glycerophosphoryl diester phosphodiesterase family protein [Cryptosporidium andersoni]